MNLQPHESTIINAWSDNAVCSGGLRRRGGLCNNYRGGLLGSKFQNAVVCTKAHYNRHLTGSYLKSANQASSFNARNVEASFTASNW